MVVKGDHKGKPIDFYGVIREIIELKYLGGNSVFLFKCDWWDVGNEKIGIKVDEFNCISVNVTKTWYKDEPFVLACQAEQVFYLKDTKWGNNYQVVQRVLPRAIYDILVKEDEEEAEEEDKDKDEPYQQFESYGLGDVVHIDDQPIELCKEDMEMTCVDITSEFHEEELEVDDEVLINDNNADDDDTNMDDQVDDDMIDDDTDLADFRMGINLGPPIMSREEFETWKADLWRKHATESVAAKALALAPAATAEKVLKKTNAKASVQKGKILEVVKEVPLDPMAEKLRQERGRGQGGYVPNKLAATSFASTSTQSIPSFTSKFVPPTTSASTSAAASASASASMHEVTSQASYLDTFSTGCCIADTTERKKGRRKSRSLALLKIKSQGKRLDVEICRITGNPLGPWSDKFTTELGIVTRQFAPQNVPKWSFFSPGDKETLIAYLRRRNKKLKERENEAIEDRSGPLSDEQLSIEVFGRKSGYISGLGCGPKPSTTASGRRTRAALEIENEETRRERNEESIRN
ncbi:unnamed protein product [Camellia sinensis]